MNSQNQPTSSGARLRAAIEQENPLQIVGTVNAFCGLLAKRAGFRAIYLSGAGVANYSFGIPDLGITTMNDVVADIQRVHDVCDLPMLVDADTGWGSAFNIARTVREFIRAGAAGLHLEDQVGSKRCGHRPGKVLVPADEHSDRIKAAVDAKTDNQFVIMARTDAAAGEGLQSAIDRACQYVEAGADMIFAEALGELTEYRKFVDAVKVPVLANLTEFGKTPLFTLDQLKSVGVQLALYPLSAARAMALAAQQVYASLRKEGTQQSSLGAMMTRDNLYEVLDYHTFEQKLDQLFAK